VTDRAAAPLVRVIRKHVEDQRIKDAPDQDLLRRFGRERDEAAFLACCGAHGPMVLSVCRTVLGREADAEDASKPRSSSWLKRPGRSGRPRRSAVGCTGSRTAPPSRRGRHVPNDANTRACGRGGEAPRRPTTSPG